MEVQGALRLLWLLLLALQKSRFFRLISIRKKVLFDESIISFFTEIKLSSIL